MSKPTYHGFVISAVGLLNGFSDKEIGARAGFDFRKVSRLLRAERIGDEDYRRLLAGADGNSAQATVAGICFQALTSLVDDTEFHLEDLKIIELSALSAWKSYRQLLREMLRRSRQALPFDKYPEPHEIEPARWLAGVQLTILQEYSWARRLKLVRSKKELQAWAICELAVEWSVEAASRDLEDAAGWARLAWEAAQRVKGPEGWCNRVKGFGRAAWPNVLRAKGKLKAAAAEFPEAKSLWLDGWDPLGILDPGRMLDWEASLCRDQRQFETALELLEQALPLSRCPARILINKGFTLEVMGEYQRAIDALLHAETKLDRQAEPRLWMTQRFNLSVNYCHIGNHGRAAELLAEARPIALSFGEKIVLLRFKWLDGRIAAGLGRRADAHRLLVEAHKAFTTLNMTIDAALALMEESALLLEEGRRTEIKLLAGDLAVLLESEGLHQEALAALQLFYEAITQENATAELARRILSFLFRSRHDPDLHFNS